MKGGLERLDMEKSLEEICLDMFRTGEILHIDRPSRSGVMFVIKSESNDPLCEFNPRFLKDSFDYKNRTTKERYECEIILKSLFLDDENEESKFSFLGKRKSTVTTSQFEMEAKNQEVTYNSSNNEFEPICPQVLAFKIFEIPTFVISNKQEAQKALDELKKHCNFKDRHARAIVQIRKDNEKNKMDAKHHPLYSKYFEYIEEGYSIEVVKEKMELHGVDPNVLDLPNTKIEYEAKIEKFGCIFMEQIYYTDYTRYDQVFFHYIILHQLMRLYSLSIHNPQLVHRDPHLGNFLMIHNSSYYDGTYYRALIIDFNFDRNLRQQTEKYSVYETKFLKNDDTINDDLIIQDAKEVIDKTIEKYVENFGVEKLHNIKWLVDLKGSFKDDVEYKTLEYDKTLEYGICNLIKKRLFSLSKNGFIPMLKILKPSKRERERSESIGSVESQSVGSSYSQSIGSVESHKKKKKGGRKKTKKRKRNKRQTRKNI